MSLIVNDTHVLPTYNLRDFITERLTAAAVEISSVFEQTIVQYQKEIDRQRRLLDFSRKPESSELLQPSEEDEVLLTEQNWEENKRTSQQDHSEIQHPLFKNDEHIQIKEEQEESCSSQEFLQQRFYDKIIISPTQEDYNHINTQCLNMDKPELLQTKEEELEPSQNQDGERHGLKQETDVFMVTEANKFLFKAIPAGEQKCQEVNNKHYNPTSITFPTPPPVSDGLEKLLKCDLCGLRLRNNSQMQIHMRTHTGEKPYSCQICDKCFCRKNTLNVHMRIHTGERPYCCKLCGKNYRNSGSFYLHMRSHTGEKPHRCGTCGKNYSILSQLTRHMQTHTGDKPYVCHTCGKMYYHRSSLKTHLRFHRAEKP